MDLKGTIVDTKLKIYPSQKFCDYLKTLPSEDLPINILKLLGKDKVEDKNSKPDVKVSKVQINNEDIANINKIQAYFKKIEINTDKVDKQLKEPVDNLREEKECVENETKDKSDESKSEDLKKKENFPYLMTADIDWLYEYLEKTRSNKSTDIPYLHELLEGSEIETPENRVLKRNPVLEERCVKLRAQQEAREYRKMTKTVDNVRMNFPEDSIAYQMRQLNRQLIAVGQFILSIFAGFLFGFKGVEWMIGSLDFGFKLLLGVMCALVIALAEIYFLAKKLNEELNVPETTQLGGPPKYVKQPETYGRGLKHQMEKEHED